jgi:phage/plasmid-like protein (TIGR03299 family)
MNTQTKQTKLEMMQNAGLTWMVSAKKIFLDNGAEIPGFKAITRNDTGDVFHVAGSRYEPFQNEALFNVIEQATETGQAKYIKAGSYRGGAFVYGVCAVPDSNFEVTPGDVCKTYLRFSTTHDGSGSINIWPEVYRQICSNGMHAWRKDQERSISVRHTISAGRRVTLDAGKLLQREREYFARFSRQCQELARKEFKALELDSFLYRLFEVTPQDEISTKMKNQMDEIRNLAQYGTGQDLIKGTAWAVYNGVTEYVTHMRGSNDEKRALSALVGSGRDLRERAFELLTAPVLS